MKKNIVILIILMLLFNCCHTYELNNNEIININSNYIVNYSSMQANNTPTINENNLNNSNLNNNEIANNNLRYVNFYNSSDKYNDVSIHYLQNLYPEIYYTRERRFYSDYWDEFTEITKIQIIEKNYSINHKNDILYLLLSGIAPDIIACDLIQLNYLYFHDLLIPLNEYIIKANIMNDDFSYIHYEIINNDIVALSIPMKPSKIYAYNKKIINNLGLIDPLELWINDKWTWDTWLDNILIIKNENIIHNFEVLGPSDSIEYAFLVSNGAQIITLNDKGNYIYNIDNNYLNTVEFIHSVVNKYYIYNMYNSNIITGDDWENKLIDGSCFTILIQPFSLIKYINNNRTMFKCSDDIGFICNPRGPDLSLSKPVKNYGYHQVYAIPYSCNNLESTIEFLTWVLTDIENYIDRRKFYTEFLYDNSIEMYNYGRDWAYNSYDINPSSLVNKIFGDLFSSIPNNQLNEKNITYQFQEIIDKYINIF